MNTSVEILCEHAARTLPDSISERKTILRAMEKILHGNHPVCRDVRAQLAAIAAIEKLQEELPMKFFKKISPSHDGHFGKDGH